MRGGAQAFQRGRVHRPLRKGAAVASRASRLLALTLVLNKAPGGAQRGRSAGKDPSPGRLQQPSDFSR